VRGVQKHVHTPERTAAMFNLAVKKFEMTCYGDGVCVVRLSESEYGSLDAEKLAAVRDFLLELASLPQVSYLVLDLSNVRFLGAAFAGALVEAWQRLRKRSRPFAVCGLTPYCAELIYRLCLDTLFPIYSTQRAALASLDHTQSGRDKQPEAGSVRVHIRDWGWDPKKMVCVDFLDEDDFPVRSVVQRRGRLSLADVLGG
jgi:anti-anti-sigma factor